MTSFMEFMNAISSTGEIIQSVLWVSTVQLTTEMSRVASQVTAGPSIRPFSMDIIGQSWAVHSLTLYNRVHQAMLMSLCVVPEFSLDSDCNVTEFQLDSPRIKVRSSMANPYPPLISTE